MAGPYPSSGSGGGGSKSPRGDRSARRLFVVSSKLLPKAPEAVEKKETLRRLGRKGTPPNYWGPIDWRDHFQANDRRALAGALTPGDQKRHEACAGFAVAHALRANVAIHRGVDVKVNPYLIWGLARESDPRWEYGKAGLLHSALLVVNNYGIPTLPGFGYRDANRGGLRDDIPKLALDFMGDRQRKAGSSRKIQGIVDLGQYLGDLSAWLHSFGPVAVHMMIDREQFDQVDARKPIIEFDDTGVYDGQMTRRFAAHDVVVVGYVPRGRRGRPSDSFIVMNSYGPNWGDQGFAYVKVKTAQRCFRAAFGLLLREHLGYAWGGTPGPQAISRLCQDWPAFAG